MPRPSPDLICRLTGKGLENRTDRPQSDRVHCVPKVSTNSGSVNGTSLGRGDAR